MLESNQKTRDILKKVRQIELRARILIDEAFCGNYHSIFRGQGIHFEENREYCFGDEIRFIDWNVTARMNKPYIKVFREERELTLLLAVDISHSTCFGSTQQSKREYAAEIASVLAFSAVRNNDKVGLLLFSDQVEKFISPQKGHQHLLRLIREILFFEPEHKKTNIAVALSTLSQLQKRKAIIGLISDFQIPTKDTADSLKAMRLINKRHDLICIHTSDPREQQLADVGYIALQDPETDQTYYVNTHKKNVLKQFEEEAKKRQEVFYNECQKQGIDVVKVNNGEPYFSLLQAFFIKRKQIK